MKRKNEPRRPLTRWIQNEETYEEWQKREREAEKNRQAVFDQLMKALADIKKDGCISNQTDETTSNQ